MRTLIRGGAFAGLLAVGAVSTAVHGDTEVDELAVVVGDG